MNELAQFHFLRPGWFLLLIPAAILFWSFARRHDSRGAFYGVIDSTLLEHLLTRADTKPSRLRPLPLMGVFVLIGIIALAGPAWQREVSPFTEDEAALAIVLKLTPEMLSADIQPSRLQRSIFKIKDLLESRPGTRNALIAYAGSAHLVMPLTTDAGIINSFASALAPDLMPEPGDEPAEAIELASSVLGKAGFPASIVLITDDIDASHLETLTQAQKSGAFDVHLFAVAAGPEVIPPPDSPPAQALNLDNMRAAADALNGSLTVVSADDTDLRHLNAQVRKSFVSAPLQEGSRWRDAGFYLLPVLLLLLLPFFRHGGAVSLRSRGSVS